MLITHNLGIISDICDDLIVMYAGRIVETGSVREIFSDPKHPYTKGLIDSIPSLRQKREILYSIPGMVPQAVNFPSGCRFHPRCSLCRDVCRTEVPAVRKISGSHYSRCHFAESVTG